MNKLAIISLTFSLLALAIVSSIAIHDKNGSAVPESTATHESSYDHFIRTNTLRCGYATWQPGIYKDPATGQMKGLFKDLIEQMGRLGKFKVEWVSEVDWGQIAEALQTHKIDAFCAGMANDAARGKRLAYTKPLSYWTFDVIVRADDTRFSGDAVSSTALNKADYKTAYTEGDVLETIAKGEFPLVQGIPLPPLGTPADNVMNVISKKTDFVVMPKVMFQAFEGTNPGQLRYLQVSPPLRTYGNVIAVSMDDMKLRQALDAAIDEMTASSSYGQIMKEYDATYPDAFIPVKNP